MKKCRESTLAFFLLLWWMVLLGCQAGKEPTIAPDGEPSYSTQEFIIDVSASLYSPALADSVDPGFRNDLGDTANIISVHVCGQLADDFGLAPQDSIWGWTPDSTNMMVEVQPEVYQLPLTLYTGKWFYKFVVVTLTGQAWTRDPLNGSHGNPWGNSEIITN